MKPWAVALLLISASPAVAQQKQDDPLKEMQYGQRVELILRSGFGVLGKLIPFTDPATGDEIPLAQAKTILLDMSLEYPDMGGSKDPLSGKFLPNLVGFERLQVKSSRRLPSLTPEEVLARERAREDAYARILAEEAGRRRREQEVEEARKSEIEERRKKKKMEEAKSSVEGKLKQEVERFVQARGIYEKFPPPEWGPERLKTINGKPVLGQKPTPEETEFLDNYGEWIWYQGKLQEEKQKTEGSAEEPKKEEPKPEEPKKEEPQ
ncbi:MAG: hypothetical protein HYY16_17740 [Planctomycetes bacterium]|nr:hypothetical protein [Planctomycetota bacterium]